MQEDGKNLTIGVLSVTATILLVGIILTTVGGHNVAVATIDTDRGGDYTIATGQFSQSTEQVYVIDAAARRLNAYSYDKTRRQLIIWDSQDLGRMFGGAQGRK